MNWKSPHNRKLPVPRGAPLVMGVLNVGAFSFSDGGRYVETSAASDHAAEMLRQGADIIDIGAESTRPDAAEISAAEESAALLPKIRAVRKRFPDAAISADTYKPEVAEAAIEAGADIINDVYANRRADGSYPMAEVVSRLNAPLILTHSCRGEAFSGGFFDFFMDSMKSRIDAALASGVSADMLVLDPGVGFGKTAAQNFELIKRLGELRAFGFPILLGVSRKSLFAEICGSDMSARDAATCAVSAYAAARNSCDILRVHNVAANVAAIKTILKLS